MKINYLINMWMLWLSHPNGMRKRPFWTIRKMISELIFVIRLATPIRQILNAVEHAIRER